MKIRRFEDLKVWQLSHKLSIEIAELVKSFPRDEKYDLGGQMRRSARSIPSDISEGFGRFHFNDKLTFYERCGASLGELRNHFQEALGNKYIDEDCYKSFFGKINEIGYLLNRMMKGVRTARDLHENEKRSKRSSRRSLPGLPKLLSEGGTSIPKG
jgi:four helix bundle protein